jgi:hypothetical protein
MCLAALTPGWPPLGQLAPWTGSPAGCAGFPAVDDAYRNFTYGWATKFVQLKAYAETGKPQAFFDAGH